MHDHQHQNHADKQNLAGFDADIEHEQRQWNCLLRQTNLGKGTSESEAVNEAKYQCNNPRVPLCQCHSTLAAVHDLDGKEQNT
jgi:hypothetical protein